MCFKLGEMVKMLALIFEMLLKIGDNVTHVEDVKDVKVFKGNIDVKV